MKQVKVTFCPHLRETYNLQEHYRADLIRLPEVSKDYSNLNVSVWRHASGKTAYEKNGNTVYIDEIVKVINARPLEEFLVVRHKDHEELDAEIKKRIIASGRVRFSYWGVLNATNDYCNTPNVIITSPLAYQLGSYEALARASATLRTSGGILTDDQILKFKHAEYSHHLLQAICRIRVRKSEGSGCPQARVWLIAPKGILTDAMLMNIFPNCNIEKWEAKPEELNGTRKKSFNYILSQIASGLSSVPASAVRKHLGMTQSNFKRDILKNDTFNNTLPLHKICIEQRSNNRYYFNDMAGLANILSSLVQNSNQIPYNSAL